MRDVQCSKGFPKNIQEGTIVSDVTYPIYHRRDNVVKIHVRQCYLDNRSVVPYSPYLLYKYSSHINVELCSSVKSAI